MYKKVRKKKKKVIFLLTYRRITETSVISLFLQLLYCVLPPLDKRGEQTVKPYKQIRYKVEAHVFVAKE